MAANEGGGGPNRKVSKKPPVKGPVKPSVKTQGQAPTPQQTPKGINPNVQKRVNYLSNLAPNYVTGNVDRTGMTGINKINPWLGTRFKYGDILTQGEYNALPKEIKQLTRNWGMAADIIPDAEPQYAGPGYTPKRYGGGGGGGGIPTPPIPEMKIRTTAGIRRSPYWESDDPYNQVFEPRFVILGNANGWG